MTRTSTTIPVLLALLVLPASTLAGHHMQGETRDWNARAVKLSGQLEATLFRALAAAEKAKPQETALQQRTRDAAVAQMRGAHEMSREYAEKLRGGWGPDESEPFFQQLRQATGRARETARDAVPDPTVAPHLDRMDALLAELAASYEHR